MADAGLAALAGVVDRLNRRVGGIEDALGAIAEEVAAIGDAPERQLPASWLAEHTDDQARELLADLVSWLGVVYQRYAGATMPACWLWHPAAVEELLWLRQAHLDAYTGRHASITRVADWHDRHRPGVARRLTAAIGKCDPTEHGPDGQPQHPLAPGDETHQPDDTTITKALSTR